MVMSARESLLTESEFHSSQAESVNIYQGRSAEDMMEQSTQKHGFQKNKKKEFARELETTDDKSLGASTLVKKEAKSKWSITLGKIARKRTIKFFIAINV